MAYGPSARYRVYLLTVWREDCAGESSSAGLRFSLKDPRTGERRGFAGVEALAAALASTVPEDTAPELSESGCCAREVPADGESEEE